MVSRRYEKDNKPTPCNDEELQKSLNLLREELPFNFEWPHRGGLGRALQRQSIIWEANVKVDVTCHLKDRMARWIVIRLNDIIIDQPGITEKHRWTIARHIVSTLTWGEKNAPRADKNDRPIPPSYEKPAGIDELIDAAVLEKIPALSQELKDRIWKLFNKEVLGGIGESNLPLCASNFGKTRYDTEYGTFAVASHQDGRD